MIDLRINRLRLPKKKWMQCTVIYLLLFHNKQISPHWLKTKNMGIKIDYSLYLLEKGTLDDSDMRQLVEPIIQSQGIVCS